MQSIVMYFSLWQKDWDIFLFFGAYASNTSLSETTSDTSFLITYGREPRNFADLLFVELKDQSQSIDYPHEGMMLQVHIARDLAKDHAKQA